MNCRLEWTEDFVSGNEQIDHDHKRLFQTKNYALEI